MQQRMLSYGVHSYSNMLAAVWWSGKYHATDTQLHSWYQFWWVRPHQVIMLHSSMWHYLITNLWGQRSSVICVLTALHFLGQGGGRVGEGGEVNPNWCFETYKQQNAIASFQIVQFLVTCSMQKWVEGPVHFIRWMTFCLPRYIHWRPEGSSIALCASTLCFETGAVAMFFTSQKFETPALGEETTG